MRLLSCSSAKKNVGGRGVIPNIRLVGMAVNGIAKGRHARITKDGFFVILHRFLEDNADADCNYRATLTMVIRIGSGKVPKSSSALLFFMHISCRHSSFGLDLSGRFPARRASLFVDVSQIRNYIHVDSYDRKTDRFR